MGLVISPVFSKQRQKFPNFIINFPMSDFVLHFGENFMKIAPKITKLWLITFKFVVGLMNISKMTYFLF